MVLNVRYDTPPKTKRSRRGEWELVLRAFTVPSWGSMESCKIHSLSHTLQMSSEANDSPVIEEDYSPTAHTVQDARQSKYRISILSSYRTSHPPFPPSLPPSLSHSCAVEPFGVLHAILAPLSGSFAVVMGKDSPAK